MNDHVEIPSSDASVKLARRPVIAAIVTEGTLDNLYCYRRPLGRVSSKDTLP